MSTSDFIDAMDSISRDLEREKEEMAALLQRKGAGHVERLKRRIERDLSEVEEAIERAQDKMREEVERVVKRYGPETTPVERREAAEEVARGFGSDLFAEAMRRLHEAAQQTEDTRRQKARKGRYKHAKARSDTEQAAAKARGSAVQATCRAGRLTPLGAGRI